MNQRFAAEIAVRLRAARQVRVEVADDLPTVEVPAAIVELVLNNFITNAAKYRDESSTDSWVRIDGKLGEGDEGCEVTVLVRDNGLGVPEDARDRLFDRFVRAHEPVSNEKGSGLGLAIVRETLESVDGRAWAEFPEKGSIFGFSMPCHK